MQHPRPDRTLVLGKTVVEVWDGNCVRTTLPDGAVIMAAPQDSDDYRRRAWDHGYQHDTFALCAEHEVGHSLLAYLLGLPESPALRAAVTAQEATHLTNWDEAATLALAAYCNHAGVRLLDLAERYSSRDRIGDG